MNKDDLYWEVIRRCETEPRDKVATDLGVKFGTVRRWVQRHNKFPDAKAPRQGGSKTHYHGIPPEEAEEMRRKKGQGWTAQEIMKHFGRGRSSVYGIVRGIA